MSIMKRLCVEGVDGACGVHRGTVVFNCDLQAGPAVEKDVEKCDESAGVEPAVPPGVLNFLDERDETSFVWVLMLPP